MIRKIALAQSETKTARFVQENQPLLHNGTVYWKNLLYTTQGLQAGEGFQHDKGVRVGDEVIARGVRLDVQFFNKLDRPNVTYKFIIFKYSTQAVETTGGQLTDMWFWRGTDGAGAEMNRMIDHPASERVKIVKQIVVESKEDYTNANVESANFAREKSYLRNCYIPLDDMKIKYNGADSPQPMYTTLGLAIVAYDAFGTQLSDNIATYALSYTFYFKDP